jgi:hypothetical protein
LRVDRLVTKDEFLNHFMTPLAKSNLNNEDVAYCMAIYAVAAPKLNMYGQGGINVDVLGRDLKKSAWNMFKRVEGIVPDEFRLVRSRNFYENLEYGEPKRPIESVEISTACFNRIDIEVHLPLPLNLKLRSYSAYKDDMAHFEPIAKTFLLDSLLFQPTIPDDYDKKVEEAMYHILEEITYQDGLPFKQDIGSAIPRLITAIARLNTKPVASLKDLQIGLDAWENMMDQTKKSTSDTTDIDDLYRQTQDENILYEELRDMQDSGIEITIEKIKAYTKIPSWNLAAALKGLIISGRIFVKPNGTIGVVKY